MAFDEHGLPLGHEVFEGNTADTSTLESMLVRLDQSKPDTSELKPIVILDAGFASRANLDLLKVRGYHYLIDITPGSRRKYAAHFRNEAFEALPGRSADQQVEVLKISDPDDPDSQLVLCRSAQRHQETAEEALALCGDYVLKTDKELEAPELWNLYMTLLRAESGFRKLKGSLGLRPNFHQIEDRVEGHIFISVLAYHLLCWVQRKFAGAGDPRDFLE